MRMQTVFDARVTAAFGRHLLVRDSTGRALRARAFGRRISVVCGDQVRCELDAQHAQVHVLDVHPRRTTLYRSSARGVAEPVVANVTLLLAVLAPRPEPDEFVIDRYLCAATSASIAAVLVVNKRELGIEPALRSELAAWASAGHRSIECSALTGAGIDSLVHACAGEVAVLVGQSGVGKSSLVRKLVPDAEIATGELLRDEEGRHTTTASRLYDLPHGGQLIDSPGVRDFAPALEHLDDRTLGFADVERLAPQCRFLDCRHMREPSCAVRAAAESGALHARRYESYRRLRRLYEGLSEAKRTRGR